MSSPTSTKIGLVEQSAVQSHGKLHTLSIPEMTTRDVFATNSEAERIHVLRVQKLIIVTISVTVQYQYHNRFHAMKIPIKIIAKVFQSHVVMTQAKLIVKKIAVSIQMPKVAMIQTQDQSMSLILKRNLKRSGRRNTIPKNRSPEPCSRSIG